MIVLLALVLYAAAGIAIAAAFLVSPIGSPRTLAHPGLGGRIGLGDGAGTAAAARCASSTGNGGT